MDFVPLLRQTHFLQAPGSLSISEHYRQRGAVTLGSLLSGVVLGLVLLWADPRPLTCLIILGIALLGLVGAVLFASLTVAVTATHLRWWFGPGLIRTTGPAGCDSRGRSYPDPLSLSISATAYFRAVFLVFR